MPWLCHVTCPLQGLYRHALQLVDPTWPRSGPCLWHSVSTCQPCAVDFLWRCVSVVLKGICGRCIICPKHLVRHAWLFRCGTTGVPRCAAGDAQAWLRVSLGAVEELVGPEDCGHGRCGKDWHGEQGARSFVHRPESSGVATLKAVCVAVAHGVSGARSVPTLWCVFVFPCDV